MTTAYKKLLDCLSESPKTWLITGVAGFIGSNLLESLLQLNQIVVGLDNFSTGYQHNLDEVQNLVTPQQWARFTFIRGDIRKFEDCQRACEGVDYVLHQAALGSVPRSLEDPISTNAVNVSGFLNMLIAARDANEGRGVNSFTYAASSSTYGDHPSLPKIEDNIGKPLSPYAVTKYVNELYAEVFARSYGVNSIGLRYFNVFGQRQDPEGAYAAVIPKWIAALLQNENVYINGDGETSRDFCHVTNAVQANILAATAATDLGIEVSLQSSQEQQCMPSPLNQVYNVAVGERTTLNELFFLLRDNLQIHGVNAIAQPVYREFRAGDVRHSQADISKAKRLLRFSPTHNIQKGIAVSIPWYVANRKHTITISNA